MNLLGIMLQERYRKRLTPLPFFFTFANACLGFLAIIKSLEGEYNAAVYCILAAAFMDVFDGRLARALGTTSMIGVELDSLVDGISFCLAPAVIFYISYPYNITTIQFTMLLTYVCAGLYRLAKFNVHMGTPQPYFTGLPTPMAAFCVLSLVLHHKWLDIFCARMALAQHIPFIFIGCTALLMISAIQFKKHSAFSPKTLALLACFITIVAALLDWHGYPWLLLGGTSYILATVIAHAYVWLGNKIYS